jgi:hypothetical protein
MFFCSFEKLNRMSFSSVSPSKDDFGGVPKGRNVHSCSTHTVSTNKPLREGPNGSGSKFQIIRSTRESDLRWKKMQKQRASDFVLHISFFDKATHTIMTKIINDGIFAQYQNKNNVFVLYARSTFLYYNLNWK